MSGVREHSTSEAHPATLSLPGVDGARIPSWVAFLCWTLGGELGTDAQGVAGLGRILADEDLISILPTTLFKCRSSLH